MDARELQRRVAELETISSPPGSVDRIFALAADSESRVEELAHAIESDPAVAAQLIRLANSAYFGFPSRVASVRKAVVVLGYRTVQNLAACVALAPLFQARLGGLDRARLWLHSCAVAEAARVVALELAESGPTAYLAGLLHDIGQVVLDEVAPDAYEGVLRVTTRDRVPLVESEARVLGLDHGQAAGLLGARWGLPTELVEVMRDHECSGMRSSLLGIVVLAEHLAHAEQLNGVPGDGAQVDPTLLLSEFGLEPTRYERVCDRFKRRREAIEVLYRESWRGRAT